LASTTGYSYIGDDEDLSDLDALGGCDGLTIRREEDIFE
jgi:hypothetical protein